MSARANLRHLRLANLHLLLGDGMLGFAEGAPYAGIIAAAGARPCPGLDRPIGRGWTPAWHRW